MSQLSQAAVLWNHALHSAISTHKLSKRILARLKKKGPVWERAENCTKASENHTVKSGTKIAGVRFCVRVPAHSFLCSFSMAYAPILKSYATRKVEKQAKHDEGWKSNAWNANGGGFSFIAWKKSYISQTTWTLPIQFYFNKKTGSHFLTPSWIHWFPSQKPSHCFGAKQALSWNMVLAWLLQQKSRIDLSDLTSPIPWNTGWLTSPIRPKNLNIVFPSPKLLSYTRRKAKATRVSTIQNGG